MSEKIMNARKRIAVIAHDRKKAELIDWATDNKEILSKHILYATGTTGKMLEEALHIEVVKLLSGPLGGDQQVGSLIAQGEMDMMIFFWDPMESQAHDTDVKALLRVGAVWNIPIACDRATADFLVTSPYMNTEYVSNLPDYSSYLNRKII
ncbi:MAG: methylglyoxal synthase [Flavipsychrobacter sp.]|nr:methylglyoxal synthase [Flavipsychrobacter sp.]